MKTKYSLLILALLISATLVIPLAGCSNQTTPTTPSSAATIPTRSSVLTPTNTQASSVTLNVSAAASLTDVLKEINNLYTSGKPNVTITPNFASSGTLQTQIENGAPVDIFISAAMAQMDNLQKEQLILNDTRKNLLTNKVVLVVPADSTLSITSFQDLTNDKVKKVAIGDPKSVPCGTYGQQAFDLLGITAQIQSKEILGSDVRQVLTYVESSNVDAGIVFSTDAKTSTKVKVVAAAPDEINAKVMYPVAIIKASKIPDAAKDYLNFLFSAQAKAVFEKYGFTVVSK
jgi:molybdate transport system substrate-binding protein